MIPTLRSSISRSYLFASLLVFALVFSGKVYGQVSLTNGAPTYTQDFNSLANTGATATWTDNVTLLGWYAAQTSGTFPGTYRIDSGSSTTGAIYSFGLTSASDRCLGALGSGTPATQYYGVRIKNNGTTTITSLALSYTGEQWRYGTNAAQSDTIQYLVGATSISTGTYTAVPALTFTSPIITGSATTLNGNLPANRTAISSTITVNVAPGQEIWIRVKDIDNTGSDHGLGIDDLTITATYNAVTNYYSNAAGNINVNTTWGTTTLGGGSNPANFTANGQVFHVANSNAGTFTGTTWTVSGLDSKIVLDASTNLSIGSTTSITGTIDVGAGRTLTISSSTFPTLGTLDPLSTVVFNGLNIAASPTIPVSTTYGNITFNNTIVASPATSLNLQFAGNFTLSGTSNFIGGSIASTTGGYNLRPMGSAAQTINGGGLRLVVRDFNVNDSNGAKSNTLSLNSGNTNMTVTNSILMNNTGVGNQFSDGGNTIAVYNSISMGGDTAGYNLTGTIIDSAYTGITSKINGYVANVVNDAAAAVPKFNNLTLNSTGTATISFLPTSAGTIRINGNWNIGATSTGAITLNSNTLNLKGNFAYTGQTTDRITTTGSTLLINGTGAQTYASSVTGGNTFTNLTINNGSTLSLTNNNISISTNLNLTSGKIIAGSNTVSLTASATTVTNASASSYVNGNLSKLIPASATTITYEVGDANGYAPVTLTFTGTTTAGRLSIKPTAGSGFASGSFINTSYFTNRYYTLASAVGGYTSLNALFTYNLSDISATTGGATDNTGFVVNKYTSSAWTQPISTNPTTLSTQASTILRANVAGDYVVGKTIVPSITSLSSYSAAPGATITITGANFNSTPGNNKVFFGAVQAAAITSGSTTTLVATVPVLPGNFGAIFAPVTVTIPSGLIASSSRPFAPVFDTTGFIMDSLNFKPRIELTSTVANSKPYAGAIGDIDGDGKPDIVVNNTDSSSLSIFRNISSSGTLTASSFVLYTKLTMSGKPNNIKLADLDGDGLLDVVAALTNSVSVDVFRNTSTSGAPSFAGRQSFAVSGSFVSSVIGIADFDGDAKPDVAATLLTGNAVAVIRNTSAIGTISFAAASSFAVGAAPTGLVASDLDGDGLVDLATANSGFDFVSTYSGTTASLLRNTSVPGSISFATQATITTGSGPIDIAAGDIDGDTKPDLVVTNLNAGTFSAFRNVASSGTLATASFSTKVDYTAGSGATGIAMGDLNGDGKLDVAVSNVFASTFSLFRNKAGSGTFTSSTFATKTDYATGANPTTVTIGDLDGDKYPEIVAGNQGSNTITIIKDYPLPKVDPITGTAVVCANASITLTNTTSGGTWLSVRPAVATVSTLTGTTGSVTALPSTSSDTVTIQYRVIVSGDTNFASRVVTINAQPSGVTASATPSPVCQGSSLALLGAATGATTYSWSGPNGYSSTLLNPAAFTTSSLSAGVYTLTATNANSCAAAAMSNTVTLSTPPTAVVASVTPTTVCIGNNITLTGSASGASSYSWSGPDSYVSTNANPAAFAATANSGGVYTLSAVSGACTVTATTSSVTVNVPAPTISGSTTISSGGSATLTFSGAVGDVVYYWDGGSTLSTTISASGTSTVSVSPTVTTTYSITTATSCYNNIKQRFHKRNNDNMCGQYNHDIFCRSCRWSDDL